MTQDHSVAGYEHVERAAELLNGVVDDLFHLPAAAQDRAIQQRDELGEDHGDDLICGCWASATTATAILELAGRHVDAVIHLSDDHPGFSPSAAVLARSAMESFLRVRWLLDPAAVADREHRWIALKREEARFYRNANVRSDAETTRELADLDALVNAVGGTRVDGTPSVEALVKEFGRDRALYDFFYRWNSQPTHGTLVGAATFDMDARQGWYRYGGEGEWIEAEFWAMPFIVCWEAAEIALPTYRDLLVPEFALPSLERKDEFHAALRAVPTNYQAIMSAKADLDAAARRLQSTRARTSGPAGNREQRRAKARRDRRL